MEIYTSYLSKIFIINKEGLRRPNITEVELTFQKENKTIMFDGAIIDQQIKKCRCKSDEIIIEKTRNDVLKITTAHSASHDLYKTILEIASHGNFALEINRCENLNDLFYLDKLVQIYMKSYKK